MHPMTRAVLAESQRLEFEQFRFPQDRDDINAIRVLAQEQVADDVNTTTGEHRDRIGRDWVEHVGPEFNGETLWRRWAPDQVALEAGMAVYLARLSDRQREVVRLIYAGRLTQYQVALVLGITRPTVQTFERRAIEALHRMLREAFVNTEEAA